MVRLLTLVFLVSALAGCASRDALSSNGSAGLPPFPLDKRASTFAAQRLGLETYARSADITEEGDRVVVGPPATGAISWVVYQLPTGGAAVEAVNANIWYKPSESFGGTWIAIADFARQRWQLHGPYNPAEGIQALMLSADNVSPLQNVYVAIIVANTSSRYRVAAVNLFKSGDNEYPSAAFSATPNPGIVGRDTEAILDPAGSSDSDGTIVRYQWDLDDDGKYELESPTPDPRVLVYDNPDYGNKDVSLRVTDDQGAVGISQLTVSWFQNQPPVAACQLVPATAAPGVPLTLDGSVSFDPIGSLASYEWDLDDNGVYEIDGGPAPTYELNMPAVRQNVRLRVTDDMGETNFVRLALSPDKVQVDAGQGESAAYGRVFDMLLAGGNPALVYQVVDDGEPAVRYVRALDPQGSQWATPVPITSEWFADAIDLALVGGYPALSYATGSELIYMVAADVYGDSWGAPVTAVFGDVSSSEHVALAEIAGHPAMVFIDRTDPSLNLRFICAADPQGTAWNASVGVDWWGDIYQLAEVNGAPAIAYCMRPYDWYGGDLFYVRALDVAGATWGTPLALGGGEHYVGGLEVINGLPVLVDGESNVIGTNFLRGLDGDGTAWSSVYSNGAAANGVAYSSAAGLPLIASWAVEDYTYDDKRSAFYLHSSLDANGDNWGATRFLDTARPPTRLALTGVSGGAGFAFAAQGAIYYDRVDF